MRQLLNTDLYKIMVLNCLGWLKDVLRLTDSRMNKLKIIDEGNATILQQF
jgi:hypothetical protein